MRADVVVDGLVAVDSGGEGSSVTDLIAVEILVLESLEEALDDAVGLGRAVAGTDVGELGPRGDVTSEGGRAEGAPLSVTMAIGRTSPVSGSRHSSSSEWPSQVSAFMRATSRAAMASTAVWVVVTGQASETLAT